MERATRLELGLGRVRLLRVCLNLNICYELQPFTSAPVYARYGGFLLVSPTISPQFFCTSNLSCKPCFQVTGNGKLKRALSR